MLVDYHSHINFSAFINDADEVIKRALNGGVFMILVGTQIDTSQRAVEMAEKYAKGVYAAIGLHPIHLEDMEIDEEEINFKARAEIFEPKKYRALAQSKKVVAIGECGLDYFHPHNKERQIAVFRQHLDLADELDLPVILHCRGSKDNPNDAYIDILDILKNRPLKNGGAIHCFMSTLEIARQFLDLGFYIGFTGVITFPRPKSALNGLSVGQAKTAYAEIVREVPLDKILVETDAPYLAPVPFRGKRNEPLYVRYVAEKIAEIKNMNKEDIEKQLFENTLRVFNKIEK